MDNARYFVIGTDGTRYGPADVSTLNVWAAEGRLTPATILEDAGSGQRLFASQIRSLTAVRHTTGAPDPYSSPSYQSAPIPSSGPFGGGAREVQTAWVLGILSLAAGLGILCSPLASVGGLVAGGFGMHYADRATRAGFPARNARTLCLVGIVVCILRLLPLPFMWLSL